MRNEAIIEVSIPMQYLDDSRDDDECPICTHSICNDNTCRQSSTKLTCCDQYMCCGCFAKITRRCRCTEDCDAIIGVCPFCRDMCRADVLSLYLARQPQCQGCLK